MSDAAHDDKPTPPVPPTDTTTRPSGRGTRTVSSDVVDTCDCGGTVVDEEVTTGKFVIGMWDAEMFDSDEFSLHTEWEQTERRVRCRRCNAGYEY
ncbi:hypothetical protein C5B90_19160 [Haloferax sp. Atlit-12N]|uniref:hypothetical protein n=1 Tax=Haloferax sp. Atlit-12N TaxID=2077203 RepID=UPI000E2642ED|nr:hypothetical protein [Haloferax sp. Atlit-12N]RDZ61394.1 hypothetical protein C5B90_19160 [Haloferax sp. Atlit-12N]